mmetsp:Transcript_2413/g.2644  ORF Transcript_2413/g.2644 Transcript_2413/m.2644 type:complete len:90 (-) Transcript_2413:66-335(-)
MSVSTVVAAAVPTSNFLPSLLHKSLRVSLPDGRDITGRLYCIDDKKNIILQNAIERRDKGEKSIRSIGMVMIAGKDAVKIECLKRDIPQ